LASTLQHGHFWKVSSTTLNWSSTHEPLNLKKFTRIDNTNTQINILVLSHSKKFFKKTPVRSKTYYTVHKLSGKIVKACKLQVLIINKRLWLPKYTPYTVVYYIYLNITCRHVVLWRASGLPKYLRLNNSCQNAIPTQKISSSKK